MTDMRAVAALIGLAIGDALGAPLEGLPPPKIPVKEMQGGGIHHTRPGQYTDDTMQACALAHSLIACAGFCPEDFIGRLIEEYHSNPKFFGPTSSSVLDLIDTGMAPETAAALVHERRGGSRSNGSVMRGIPLGVFYRPDTVRAVSLAASRLTHFDPVAGEASAFVNRMVSGMCRGEPRWEAYERALARCRDRELAGMLASYGAYPLEPSLDAVLCTHCAVSIFLDASSFSDAVIAAVNLGGDADTVGAITGGLAGSYWGCSAVPKPWLRALQDSAEILDLARRLWSVSQR
jgi:ADP-ribosyl-[dinitrogen reductase] hydrolase